MDTQNGKESGYLQGSSVSSGAVRQILGDVAVGKGLTLLEVNKTLDSAFKAALPRVEGMEGFKAAFSNTPITDHGEGKVDSALDFDLFRSIVEQGRPLGLSGVKLTGGEPLLPGPHPPPDRHRATAGCRSCRQVPAISPITRRSGCQHGE